MDKFLLILGVLTVAVAVGILVIPNDHVATAADLCADPGLTGEWIFNFCMENAEPGWPEFSCYWCKDDCWASCSDLAANFCTGWDEYDTQDCLLACKARHDTHPLCSDD